MQEITKRYGCYKLARVSNNPSRYREVGKTCAKSHALVNYLAWVLAEYDEKYA